MVEAIAGTQVLTDRVPDEYVGVWHVSEADTHVANLRTSDFITVPLFP